MEEWQRVLIFIAYSAASASGVYVFLRGHLPHADYFINDRCLFAALMTSTVITALIAYCHLRWLIIGGIPFTDMQWAILSSGFWAIHVALAAATFAWHRIGLRFIEPWRKQNEAVHNGVT